MRSLECHLLIEAVFSPKSVDSSEVDLSQYDYVGSEDDIEVFLRLKNIGEFDIEKINIRTVRIQNLDFSANYDKAYGKRHASVDLLTRLSPQEEYTFVKTTKIPRFMSGAYSVSVQIWANHEFLNYYALNKSGQPEKLDLERGLWQGYYQILNKASLNKLKAEKLQVTKTNIIIVLGFLNFLCALIFKACGSMPNG